LGRRKKTCPKRLDKELNWNTQIKLAYNELFASPKNIDKGCFWTPDI
jgi:hypothetical protein